MSQVPLIKIEKKTKSKIDQAKIIILIYCQLSDIHLSDAELTTLAYFIVYKLTEQTKELILKSKVLSSEGSLGNTMSKLRKHGLIKKEDRIDIINSSLNIELQPVIGMFIKIDNK